MRVPKEYEDEEGEGRETGIVSIVVAPSVSGVPRDKEPEIDGIPVLVAALAPGGWSALFVGDKVIEACNVEPSDSWHSVFAELDISSAPRGRDVDSRADCAVVAWMGTMTGVEGPLLMPEVCEEIKVLE